MLKVRKKKCDAGIFLKFRGRDSNQKNIQLYVKKIKFQKKGTFDIIKNQILCGCQKCLIVKKFSFNYTLMSFYI